MPTRVAAARAAAGSGSEREKVRYRTAVADQATVRCCGSSRRSSGQCRVEVIGSSLSMGRMGRCPSRWLKGLRNCRLPSSTVVRTPQGSTGSARCPPRWVPGALRERWWSPVPRARRCRAPRPPPPWSRPWRTAATPWGSWRSAGEDRRLPGEGGPVPRCEHDHQYHEGDDHQPPPKNLGGLWMSAGTDNEAGWTIRTARRRRERGPFASAHRFWGGRRRRSGRRPDVGHERLRRVLRRAGHGPAPGGVGFAGPDQAWIPLYQAGSAVPARCRGNESGGASGRSGQLLPVRRPCVTYQASGDVRGVGSGGGTAIPVGQFCVTGPDPVQRADRFPSARELSRHLRSALMSCGETVTRAASTPSVAMTIAVPPLPWFMVPPGPEATSDTLQRARVRP